MRQVLDFAPVFTPAARTLNFTGMSEAFALRRLFKIVNTTRDEVIFEAGVPYLGATQAGSIITLEWNVTGHNAADVLVIEYDPIAGDPVVANEGTPNTGTGYSAVSAASTNAVAIKAAPGNVYELTARNPTAGQIFIKLFDKATAPTLGTDIPLVTIPLAAGAAIASPLEFGRLGKRFSTGIAIAITGALADADATPIAAGAHVSLTYV